MKKTIRKNKLLRKGSAVLMATAMALSLAPGTWGGVCNGTGSRLQSGSRI